MRNGHPVFPVPMPQSSTDDPAGGGPAEQTLGDESSATLTHVCTQSTPMHIHLHASTHYTYRHTTHAHTRNVCIPSPHTRRTHPEGTHSITAPQEGMPSTQHPCARYQKPPPVPKVSQCIRNGVILTPLAIQSKTLKAAKGLLPPRSPVPASPLPTGQTDTAPRVQV